MRYSLPSLRSIHRYLWPLIPFGHSTYPHPCAECEAVASYGSSHILPLLNICVTFTAPKTFDLNQNLNLNQKMFIAKYIFTYGEFVLVFRCLKINKC